MTKTCACNRPATTTRTIRRWVTPWDHATDLPLGPGDLVAESTPMCAECAEGHDEVAMMGRHA